MKKVAILAVERATSFSIMGSLDMLIKVNEIGRKNPEATLLFDPRLVSVQDRLVKSSSGHPFYCDKTIRDPEKYDLILIPSCDGDIIEIVANNTTLISWLQEQHQKEVHIASMCTGAFILAKTGLLEGKAATTHWAYMDLFHQLHPDVSLKVMENIVDNGTLICGGGGTSFIQLIMYLIEKYYGHELAVLCSKIMLADMDKMPQSSYSIFTGYKQHQDGSILKVQEYIEASYRESISIAAMADHAALSERTLNRRFKAVTGITPIDYIQKVRVEAAKKLLEESNRTVSAIMEAVGYNDLGNFRSVFQKQTGTTMKEYRKKFQRLIRP